MNRLSAPPAIAAVIAIAGCGGSVTSTQTAPTQASTAGPTAAAPTPTPRPSPVAWNHGMVAYTNGTSDSPLPYAWLLDHVLE